MLSEGTFLQNNRYRIDQSLGQGGMGAVYRAWHTGLEIPVAIKEMVPQPGLSPEMLQQLRAQFKREANILARLSHGHLVHVMDSFEEGGNAYLVMELVSGDSMASRIRDQGAIPEAVVMQWAQQLLDALAYCHGQGIIHRDIKPHNIIIRSDERAVLVDFGLVKLWDPHDPYTKTVMRGMGTPEYAPPEQYDADAGHTDARSDIYSLGATLYHALAGKAPPTATTRIVNPQALMPVHAIGPAVHPQVEQALMRSMELRPIDRFQSAQEMATALRAPTMLLHPASQQAAQRAAPQPQIAQQPQAPVQQVAVRPPSQPLIPPQPLPPSQPSMPAQPATAVLDESPFAPHPMLPPAPAQTGSNRNWMSVMALLLSLAGIGLTFILPWCNLPAVLPGVILGFLGRRSSRRKMATLSIVICVLILLLDAVVTIVALYWYSTGQLDSYL
ncbi:MAG: serine/threonine protein kinase [Anaerolineae bacterium]|nr:serine/threonine protein kinase [Anaerolineae bacterium]